MLYLHYLVWLHRVFYLAKLHICLLSNPQYAADIVNFIDTIICYSIADVLSLKVKSQKTLLIDIFLSKNISHEAPSASLNKNSKEFALKLYKDSNAVASKI